MKVLRENKIINLDTKEGRQEFREIVKRENPEFARADALQVRVKELEDAIRLHRTKVQLVQAEDMELWAHLNDGEQ